MLKRNVLIPVIWILLLVFWSLATLAQDTLLWSRTYGGSYPQQGHSVQQTADGGYIVVGWTYFFGAGDRDVYLIKTNSTGDTLWSRAYGGSEWDEGSFVRQTSDEGYIVVGVTESFGAGERDVYLIKTDSLGDTLWTRTYGGTDWDRGNSVQQTGDGGYIIVAGWSQGSDVWLIKTDSTGDTLWTRTYGGSSTDRGNSVQQTADGGYIVAGRTYSVSSGSDDVYLIKTDPTGDTLWTRTYGGSSVDYGYCVQQTTDGGYIVTGKTSSFGAGNFDVYLIKSDSLGNTLWARTYGGAGDEYGYCVQQTADGGYTVAGETNSFGAGSYSVYVIRTDSTGDALWSRAYGGSNMDRGESVQQTAHGEYIVTGYTQSFGAGGSDVMLTKLDSLGNTCIGEFVSSTVMSFSPTVTSPPTVVTCCSTIVTSAATQVTSPATEVTTVCVVIRGDANGDGIINLGDLVYLIGYLYKGGPAPDPMWAGDCNCDGIINVADVVYLVNYLYRGGDPPACP